MKPVPILKQDIAKALRAGVATGTLSFLALVATQVAIFRYLEHPWPFILATFYVSFRFYAADQQAGMNAITSERRRWEEMQTLRSAALAIHRGEADYDDEAFWREMTERANVEMELAEEQRAMADRWVPSWDAPMWLKGVGEVVGWANRVTWGIGGVALGAAFARFLAHAV